MTSSDALDAWKFCQKLSVVQAALLIRGFDPVDFEGVISVDKPDGKQPSGYFPVFQALKDSILAGDIDAHVVSKDINSRIVIGMIPDEKRMIEMAETDWKATTVFVADLKAWLQAKSMKPPFFFASEDLDVSDVTGQFYAPKLAAAIKAWAVVTSTPARLKNKSPKQALEAWLKENATTYGLSGTAIEEISKVANWKQEGGAPSTPSSTKAG